MGGSTGVCFTHRGSFWIIRFGVSPGCSASLLRSATGCNGASRARLLRTATKCDVQALRWKHYIREKRERRRAQKEQVAFASPRSCMYRMHEGFCFRVFSMPLISAMLWVHLSKERMKGIFQKEDTEAQMGMLYEHHDLRAFILQFSKSTLKLSKLPRRESYISQTSTLCLTRQGTSLYGFKCFGILTSNKNHVKERSDPVVDEYQNQANPLKENQH